MTQDFDADEFCRRHAVVPDAPSPGDKLGIALSTLHLPPLNGLRHPRESGTCGWFIWGGSQISDEPDFFEPLHVSHLPQICPRALPFLALPAGWRFLAADGQLDVWHDESLKHTGEG